MPPASTHPLFLFHTAQIHAQRTRAAARATRERRVLRRGLGEFRSFLDPAACSQWASNFPEGVAFIHGSLLVGGEAPELFRALVEEGQVNPFLFATDGKTVLFGCLSRKGAPSERLAVSSRASLLGTVEKFLREIVVIRESLDSLTPLVDHRYDRPFLDRIGKR